MEQTKEYWDKQHIKHIHKKRLNVCWSKKVNSILSIILALISALNRKKEDFLSLDSHFYQFPFIFNKKKSFSKKFLMNFQIEKYWKENKRKWIYLFFYIFAKILQIIHFSSKFCIWKYLIRLEFSLQFFSHIIDCKFSKHFATITALSKN